MYIATRFSKPMKSITPNDNYEAMRSAIRKYIRKNMRTLQDQMFERKDDKARKAFYTFLDGEYDHRNPSLQAYGFRIKRI